MLVRFVVFASNTKDSLSLLGRHFPNPNLKIANYPLTPTARVRPMISITPKKAGEGMCIFESTFKQSIKEKLFFFQYLNTFMHKQQVRQKGYLIKVQNYLLHKSTHWKYCCTKLFILIHSFLLYYFERISFPNCETLSLSNLPLDWNKTSLNVPTTWWKVTNIATMNKGKRIFQADMTWC